VFSAAVSYICARTPDRLKGIALLVVFSTLVFYHSPRVSYAFTLFSLLFFQRLDDAYLYIPSGCGLAFRPQHSWLCFGR
jgi:hypothetical protein